MKLEDMSREEMLALLMAIRAELESADDARDYCVWLSEMLGAKTRKDGAR
jgi:hypothetical protein